jgi:gas vesicle protein
LEARTMAKDEKADKAKKESSASKGSKSSGHPFLWGIIFGVIVGVVVGWFVKPPSALRVDDLKGQIETRASSANDKSKAQMAEWAESLAQRLRQ